MRLNPKNLKQLCHTASVAAKAAGAIVQEAVSQSGTVSFKEGAPSLASQVLTETDIKAQECILKHLEESTSQYDLALLTEESEDNASRFEKDYFWCIDPLDGTLPFTEKREGYAVSIALVSKVGEPVIGVVYDPVHDELYTAIKSEGVWLNGNPLTFTVGPTFNFISDLSLRKSEDYSGICKKIHDQVNSLDKEYREQKLSFGAVKSVLEILKCGGGIFCKPTKESDGCGSLWDYAATACIFQELGLNVTTFDGSKLELNTPSTFMNQQGVCFSTLYKNVLT